MILAEFIVQSVFLTGGIDLKAFAKKSVKGNVQRKIARFLKHGNISFFSNFFMHSSEHSFYLVSPGFVGYFLDVKVLEDCVRGNVGDVTFEVS